MKKIGFISTTLLTILFFIVLLLRNSLIGSVESYSLFPNNLDFFGLELTFFVDELSLLFVAGILGFSALASAYSIIYLRVHDHPIGKDLYFANLLFFASGMLGVVLAENIIIFLLFFEAMNIPAFFLAYFWGDVGGRQAALKYIVYMSFGAALLVGGITYIVGSTGQSSLPLLYEIIPNSSLGSNSLLATALFIGFAVKLAILPFHTWLPDFHGEAPTPISALLSAVMIKLGAYGWIRIVFPLFPDFIISNSQIFALLAIVTIAWGGYMAFSEPDFKRLLVFSSISQVGYILFGLSTLTLIGVSGAVLHIFTHATAKFLLLLVAGSLIYSIHKRKIVEMSGLASKLPVASTLMLIGALTISGAPPFAVFQSEWRIFSGGMANGFSFITLVAIILTAMTTGYYLYTIKKMIWGELKQELKEATESHTLMILSMVIVASLALVLGFAPGLISDKTDIIASTLLENMNLT